MVSVVVCTYNREDYIGQCIHHLAQQAVEPDSFEVLIINNNSTDSTDSICRKAIQTYPKMSIRYFIEENQGHSFSRNRGIKEAQGDIVAFIDDDAFVKSEYVKEIILYFHQNPKVCAVGGKIIPKYEVNEPRWMTKYLLPLVAALDMGGSARPFRGAKFPIGANMAFRKDVFDKYGLFNVKLGRKGSGLEGGDEKDVFVRLKQHNEEIHYVPTVTVDHIIPEKRVRKEYIKGLAVGVGTSERKRLKAAPLKDILAKVYSELLKSAGTLILFLYYLARLRPQAATMLLKFRLWVLKGLFFK